MNTAIWALAFAILIQIIGFSFWMGKLSQRVSDLGKQLTAVETKTATDKKDIKDQTATDLTHVLAEAHKVLPECQNVFVNLTSSIGKLECKVDMLILIMGTNNK